MGQRRLQADIGTAHHAVGHYERMWLAARKGRRKRIQPTSHLTDAPGCLPARQLPPDVGCVDTACQQQTGLKYWLIIDNFQQSFKSHADNMPQMANYCNEITTNRSTPIALTLSWRKW
jgi:hypothetical protein